MKMSVYDRILILEILENVQSNFLEKKIIRSIEEKVGFEEKELEKSCIMLKDNGQVIWKNDFEKTIDLTKYEEALMRNLFCSLFDMDLLSEDHKPLYEKFK